MNYSGRGIPQTGRKNNIPSPLSWWWKRSEGNEKKALAVSHADKAKIVQLSAKPVARRAKAKRTWGGKENIGKKDQQRTTHKQHRETLKYHKNSMSIIHQPTSGQKNFFPPFFWLLCVVIFNFFFRLSFLASSAALWLSSMLLLPPFFPLLAETHEKKSHRTKQMSRKTTHKQSARQHMSQKSNESLSKLAKNFPFSCSRLGPSLPLFILVKGKKNIFRCSWNEAHSNMLRRVENLFAKLKSNECVRSVEEEANGRLGEGKRCERFRFKRFLLLRLPRLMLFFREQWAVQPWKRFLCALWSKLQTQSPTAFNPSNQASILFADTKKCSWMLLSPFAHFKMFANYAPLVLHQSGNN